MNIIKYNKSKGASAGSSQNGGGEYIDYSSQIEQLQAQITTMRSMLQQMFELRQDSNNVTYIAALYDFASVGGVTAFVSSPLSITTIDYEVGTIMATAEIRDDGCLYYTVEQPDVTSNSVDAVMRTANVDSVGDLKFTVSV